MASVCPIAKTHDQSTTIIRALREGYGAEDIGVTYGIDPDAVRREIMRLRSMKMLDVLLGLSITEGEVKTS